jgi:hypothetical protein
MEIQLITIKIGMDLDFRAKRMEDVMTPGTFGSFPVKGNGNNKINPN